MDGKRFIRTMGLSACCVIVAACTIPGTEKTRPGAVQPRLAVQASPGPQAAALPSRTDFGPWTVARLTAWYGDTRMDCGDASRAALACTGLLIRATESTGAFHVWNPSPASVTRGGVSFSYIRTDTNFAATLNIDGFIFGAKDMTPWATDHPVALCAFPLNAGTASRAGDGGCGMRANVAVSAPCQDQAVMDGAQWVTHFTQKATSNANNQCGFSMAQGVAGDVAPAFAGMITARQAFDSFSGHDEIVIDTWPQDTGASLPLESFYYLAGTAGAAGARLNQRDLLMTDGIAVPVVMVTMPSDANSQARFAFRPADQAIEAPSLPAGIAAMPSLPAADVGIVRLADLLANDSLDVSVPVVAGAQAGDSVQVLWQGTHAAWLSPAVALQPGARTTVPVPTGMILGTPGRIEASFVVTSGAPSALQRASLPLVLVVEAQGISLASPIVLTAPSRVLIDSPAIQAGDKVTLRYTNRTGSGALPPETITAPGAFGLALPAAWLSDAPTRVHYTVIRQGNTFVSPDVIVGQLPRPVVTGLIGGWLDLGAVSGDIAVHLPSWEGMANGRKVWLDALAYYPDGTEKVLPLLDGIAVDDTIRHEGISVNLPRAWLAALADGSQVELRGLAGRATGGKTQAAAFAVARFIARRTDGPMVAKPSPRLFRVDAQGHALPIDGSLVLPALEAGETLQVRVPPWPGITAGQLIWLRLRGGDTTGTRVSSDLLLAHAVTAQEVNEGVTAPLEAGSLDAFASGCLLEVEMKLVFEFTAHADESHAMPFPVTHVALIK